MKKSYLLVVIAAVSYLAVSCNLPSGSDDSGGVGNATPEGQVFILTRMVVSTNTYESDTTYPVVRIEDMDGDGTDETVTTFAYYYYSDDTMYEFGVLEVTSDGGTTTGTLSSYEDTESATVTYTISGNMITVDGEVGSYPYSLSGNTLSLTFPDMTDNHDKDEDEDYMETYTIIFTMTAVSSPTFAQLSAEAGL